MTQAVQVVAAQLGQWRIEMLLRIILSPANATYRISYVPSIRSVLLDLTFELAVEYRIDRRPINSQLRSNVPGLLSRFSLHRFENPIR